MYLKEEGKGVVEQGLEDFPQMEGFDKNQGVASSQGDLGVYLKLLRYFTTQLSLDFRDVSRFLETFSLTEIQHKAHTLKGISGILGAKTITERAVTLDRTCKQNTVASFELLKQLEPAMEQAQRVMAAYLPLRVRNEEPVAEEEGRSACMTLKQLLKDSEWVEDPLLDTVCGYLARQEEEGAKRLRELVSGFSSDEALELLEKMEERGSSI